MLWTGWLGTPIHESSHLLMCPVFRHRVDEVAFFEPDRKSGRLGYVRHSFHQGNWFEEMGNLFIGIAPLIGGSVVLLTLLFVFYPDAANAAWAATSISENHPTILDGAQAANAVDLSSSPAGIWEQLWLRTNAMVSKLLTLADWTGPRWWIFLYLVLCVGSHMAPSKSDYQGSFKGALIAAAIFAGLIAVISFLQIDATSFADLVISVGTPLITILALAVVLCGISTMLVIAITSLIPTKAASDHASRRPS